jgi:hypothetical protein
LLPHLDLRSKVLRGRAQAIRATIKPIREQIREKILARSTGLNADAEPILPTSQIEIR